MKDNHQFALIVAYYLSRCDKEALINLGYKSFNEATREIGKILDVKVNTIKNMRDEFDPYHDNSRVGWLRELRGSRLKVIKSFQETDDNTLLEIVKGILFDNDFIESSEAKEVKMLFADSEVDEISVVHQFTSRGPTGKKAELFFLNYFEVHGTPVTGELVDRRDEGCGYDFEIKNGNESFYVEVKGLANATGGVLFTNKEWQKALQFKQNYFLVLVRNLSQEAEIKFIQNPAEKLKAKKNIYTTVQLSWGVTEKMLSEL